LSRLGYPPAGYARTLLDVLRWRHALRPVFAAPGVRPYDVTRERLELIMNADDRTGWFPLLARVAVAAFALAVLPGAAMTGQTPAAAGAPIPFVTVERGYPASAVDSLRIRVRQGTVKVVASEGPDVGVSVDVRVDPSLVDVPAAPRDAERHARSSVVGGALVFEDAHLDGEEGKGWTVNVTVRVPRPLPVEARADAGNVEVAAAAGDVSLHTGAGKVILAVQEPLARLDLATTFGAIEARARTVTGDIKAAAGSGDVAVRVGEPLGRVALRSGPGNVTLQLPAHPPLKDVSLQVGTGNVLLVAPPDVAGEFTLEAGLGSVDADGLPGVTRHQSGRSASGTVGSGGPSYVLKVGAGTVRATVK
jgi:hypothetical protein